MIINRFESSGSGGGEIIIDVTPITGGAVGRILFEGAGNVVSENALLSYDVATTTLYSYKGLIGESDGTTYPNAQFISSQATAGGSHTYNLGVVGEATADAIDTTIWGVGVYGGGLTNSSTRSAGVVGDGRVGNKTDTGTACGVRGYATDVHASGINIGILAEASGSSIANYSLAMISGNILSQVAQTWTLKNDEAALDFDSGTLVIDAKNNFIGIGATGPQARLDVRAKGALSTDIALRVRNAANNDNILSVKGDQSIDFLGAGTGGYLNLSRSGGNVTLKQRATAVLPSIFKIQSFGDGGSIGQIQFDAFDGNLPAFTIQRLISGLSDLTGSSLYTGFGVNAATFVMQNALNYGGYGTNPSGTAVDHFAMYSADIVAGNAAPHFRTENGSIIKLYKQDLPTVPTPAEIATFLSNLGLANLV